jgi:hypothetical protein
VSIPAKASRVLSNGSSYCACGPSCSLGKSARAEDSRSAAATTQWLTNFMIGAVHRAILISVQKHGTGKLRPIGSKD